MPAGNFAPGGPWQWPAAQGQGGLLTPPNSLPAGTFVPSPGAAILQAAPLLRPAAFAPGAPNPRVASPPASSPPAARTASGRVQKKKKAVKTPSRPATPGQLTWEVNCPGEAFVPTPHQANSHTKAARAAVAQVYAWNQPGWVPPAQRVK